MFSKADISQLKWHTLSTEETITKLGTNVSEGLTDNEALERYHHVGPNCLTEAKRDSFWKEFLEELREPMVLLLLATGILYAFLGELGDAIMIFFVILTLNTIEVINEQRAKKAISALRKLAEPTASVLRAGSTVEVPAEQIVPGDVILIQAGRRVPADARLLTAYGVTIDESSLTGESVPVEKGSETILAEEVPLAERSNLIYAGTLVTRGRCSAVVTGTGMTTELGHIAGLSRQIREPRTPLQNTMTEITRWMVWLALGFSVLVPALGIWLSHLPFKTMLLTGLSLAFATIPEELPIIITLVLSLGGYRLSKQHAIVKRLKAVETLGSVTVIATDKTGTLTENRMEVQTVSPAENRMEILTIGMLCSDAVPGEDGFTGDPLETALLREGQRNGMDVSVMRVTSQLLNEFTFDNSRKLMSVVRTAHPSQGENGHGWIAAKGAPESVLKISTHRWTPIGPTTLTNAAREAIMEEAAHMAENGLRMLAFAEKESPNVHLNQAEAESDLVFVGLVGLADLPRAGVKAAISDCRRAGIRTVMITGDHPKTACAIGEQVGLDGNSPILTGTELDTLDDEALSDVLQHVSIFARTTPEHKLRIVTALQQCGECVAVTGDGINDAPALVAADIGVAMGETGSDVARESADLVLADDNYITIVNAVREGRALFETLKKAVRYYLACKVALVSITLLAVLLRVPVPFAPIQIILMELFMDLAAAAAFVAEPADEKLMDRPPRDPKAAFMDKPMIGSILRSAIGLFAAVSAVYLYTWYSGAGQQTAQTAAFVAWLLGHVLLAFNLRSEKYALFQIGIFSNRLMISWGIGALVFALIATFITPVYPILKTSILSGQQWALILAAVLLGTFWIDIRKIILGAFYAKAN